MTRRRQSSRRRRVRKREHDSSRRLFYQLIVCLLLFGATFFGRALVPQQIRTLFHTDTDFVAAFSALGQSLSSGAPVGDSLGEFAVTVFGAAEIQQGTEGETAKSEKARIDYFGAHSTRRGSYPNAALTAQQRTELNAEQEQTVLETQDDAAQEEEKQQEQSQAQSVLMPVMNVPAYEGPTLPEKVSMEGVALQISGTVLPTTGVVSSGFGYRSDPLEGDERFHYGLDIAAEEGSDIVAWASGEVLYIGEGEDFGLYIKIQHENEITSFYAHCSELLCKQGDYVQAGQLIARVGSTGRSTGAHLHFELRVGEQYINPLYYLDFSA